jgi:phage shock protein A
VARAKGNYVLLELMDIVTALEKSMGDQGRRTAVVENTPRVMEERIAAVEENVDQLAESVWRVKESVDGLKENVRGLGGDVRELKFAVSEMRKGAETADETVHRLAQIVVATQRRDDDRYSSLDDRVTRLERKPG